MPSKLRPLIRRHFPRGLCSKSYYFKVRLPIYLWPTSIVIRESHFGSRPPVTGHGNLFPYDIRLAPKKAEIRLKKEKKVRHPAASIWVMYLLGPRLYSLLACSHSAPIMSYAALVCPAAVFAANRRQRLTPPTGQSWALGYLSQAVAEHSPYSD